VYVVKPSGRVTIRERESDIVLFGRASQACVPYFHSLFSLFLSQYRLLREIRFGSWMLSFDFFVMIPQRPETSRPTSLLSRWLTSPTVSPSSFFIERRYRWVQLPLVKSIHRETWWERTFEVQSLGSEGSNEGREGNIQYTMERKRESRRMRKRGDEGSELVSVRKWNRGRNGERDDKEWRRKKRKF